MAVFAGFQWYWASILGYPIGEVPVVVTFAMLALGGYGAVSFVRLADRKV